MEQQNQQPIQEPTEIKPPARTNWKFFLIMLGVTIGVGLLGFLAFGRLSTVSTNKDVYARGEDVVVSFSDFRLSRCNTGGPNLSFFSKTTDGWKGFKYERGIIYSFGQSVCVDGMLSSGAYPADIQTCRFFDRPRLSGTYIWNGRVYEEEDDQKVCGNLKSVHFYSRLAPPGKYKIKWGNAEQVFEIKEDERGQQEERVEEWKFKEDDISNWQTYRNEEFGFEVKYPREWFNNIDEEGNKKYQTLGGSYVFSNQDVQNFQKDFDITQKDSLVFFISIQKESTGSALFSIFENLRKLKEGEEFIESRPVTKERIIYAKVKDEFFANVPAVRYRTNQGEIDFSKGLFPRSSSVLAIKDDFAIVFSFQGGTQETVDRNQGTFDQILPTFRFVEE